MFSLRKILRVLCSLTLPFAHLAGTPSDVFWTVCTTDVYDTGIGVITEDNFFTVFNQPGQGSAFPPDTGFELGIFSWGDLKAEAGIDYLGGTDYPLFFNADIGIEEDKLFCHAPSFKVGIFNVGTRSEGVNRTDQNIIDFVIGHSLPDAIGGRFFVGAFSGNRSMGPDRQGFMVAYQKFFCPAKYCDGRDYYKWYFCTDYASGRNYIGGGGFGIGYNFTPYITILTGPVWFNSTSLNGNWKWAVQIDISFPVYKCKKG